jgi:hypothetical protein
VKWPLDPEQLKRIIQRTSGDVSEPYKFLADALSDVDGTFGRVMGKPIYILASYEFTIFLSDNINPQVSNSPLGTDLPIDVTLRAIQDAEIDRIVEAGRARLPRAPGVTYRAPSGRLMKSFLRIGNIQRSRSALDAVFFWLVPYLRDCTGLVTDTWSISSIAMNVSRRLAVYSSTDAMAAPCPVEMLPLYLDGSSARATEAMEIIEHLLARTTATPTCRIVFLISATHTGSLIGHVETLLLQRGIDAASVFFIALFKLGPTNAPGTALRDLSVGRGADDFTPLDSAQISDDLEPIDIDEQVYFPLQYRDVPCVVRRPETVAFREFLDRYDSAEVVKVHRTVSDDGARRHHAIWIDTVALAGHPVFKDRFGEYVRSLDPIPQLIITPLHEAAMILGELALASVREAWDNPGIRIRQRCCGISAASDTSGNCGQNPSRASTVPDLHGAKRERVSGRHIHGFGLARLVSSCRPSRGAHLCEHPGGGISCTAHTRYCFC